MKKRSLSLLLALLMVLSLVMPGTAAFADTVSAETPADASYTVLKWANKLGTDWMNAPSVPTVADDGVIVMVGTTINKLSFENGEIILNPLFTFREAEKAGDGFGNTGKVEGSLEQIGTLKHREKLRLAGYRV